jgi:hypothetical protein
MKSTKAKSTFKKSTRIAVSFLLLLTGTAVLAQMSAQKSFDQLKSLTGSWEGKTSEGKAVQVTFRNTAGGSALMSEIHGHGSEDMISMFHLDGADRLMLTHYCSAGNQPRMTASASSDGKTITFEFLDATNLATPDAGRMQRVVIAMLEANHHTEDWTFEDHGKQKKEFFDLRRSELARR